MERIRLEVFETFKYLPSFHNIINLLQILIGYQKHEFCTTGTEIRQKAWASRMYRAVAS